MRRGIVHSILWLAIFGFSAACSKGGQLTLEPGARKANKGSPTVKVNQGGKALVWEQGKSHTTGVHGWISVQTISAADLKNSAGTESAILNKVKK